MNKDNWLGNVWQILNTPSMDTLTMPSLTLSETHHADLKLSGISKQFILMCGNAL